MFAPNYPRCPICGSLVEDNPQGLSGRRLYWRLFLGAMALCLLSIVIACLSGMSSLDEVSGIVLRLAAVPVLVGALLGAWLLRRFGRQSPAADESSLSCTLCGSSLAQNAHGAKLCRDFNARGKYASLGLLIGLAPCLALLLAGRLHPILLIGWVVVNTLLVASYTRGLSRR